MTPQAATVTDAPAAAAPATARLVSLDAFRGATIALMVLVNNAGSGRDSYRQLEHAEWHGWTITDTVFPSFVWIVGRGHHAFPGQTPGRRNPEIAPHGAGRAARRRALRVRPAGLRLSPLRSRHAAHSGRAATHRHLLSGSLGNLPIHRRPRPDPMDPGPVRRLLDDDDADPRSGIRPGTPGRGRQLRPLHRCASCLAPTTTPTPKPGIPKAWSVRCRPSPPPCSVCWRARYCACGAACRSALSGSSSPAVSCWRPA